MVLVLTFKYSYCLTRFSKIYWWSFKPCKKLPLRRVSIESRVWTYYPNRGITWIQRRTGADVLMNHSQAQMPLTQMTRPVSPIDTTIIQLNSNTLRLNFDVKLALWRSFWVWSWTFANQTYYQRHWPLQLMLVAMRNQQNLCEGGKYWLDEQDWNIIMGCSRIG